MTDAVLSDGAGSTDVPRDGVLGLLQAGMDRLNGLMAVLSSIAIGLAGLVLTWEVIGRYFLQIGSDWQDEFSALLLVGATFASASWTQARRGHVAIDALSHVLAPRADALRRWLADGCACLFCGYFALKCWQLLMEAVDEGQTTPSAWGPPLWIPYGSMSLGMVLLTLQLLLQVLRGPVVRRG